MKKIAHVACMHAGHRAGLSDPKWGERDSRWHDIRCELWEKYNELIDRIGKVDLVIANGDLIDGRGQRSGSTELIVASMGCQRDIAVENLLLWKAPAYVLTRGTAYHVSWGDEDWEDLIADELKAAGKRVEIKDHAFVNVGGVMFDVKHPIGASSIPHGRVRALLLEKLQNEQWHFDKGQPLADIYVRAHIHYESHTDGHRGGRKWEAFSLPALQAAATKYGGRRCSGVVDWGLAVTEIEDKDNWETTIYKTEVKANKVKVIKI